MPTTYLTVKLEMLKISSLLLLRVGQGPMEFALIISLRNVRAQHLKTGRDHNLLVSIPFSSFNIGNLPSNQNDKQNPNM
jgi:hypothetical protein